MAQAVSAAGHEEARLVWHGRDVAMTDVLVALDKTRKQFAHEEAVNADLPHPRSCVMTLVVVVSSEDEEKLAAHTCRLIGAEHPAQAIIVREQHGVRTGKIEAWIRADVQRPEVSCARECEIVTLHVRGAAGTHLAALVDPLLVSGVPTYLWWTGTPLFGRRELEDALGICDALIVDSAQFGEPYKAFRGLARLMSSAHQKLGMVDLQWSRLRPWREMIAQFFSPVDRRAFLAGISEVGIDYTGEGRGNRIAPAVLAGWLASSLGWKLSRAASGSGGIVMAFYEGAGERSVEVNFRSVPKERLLPGELSAVRINGVANGETFRLSLLRDPERRSRPTEASYRSLHPVDGEDEAGVELASRRAEWHRDVLHETFDTQHHISTGEPPGESRPKHPAVFTRERRRPNSGRMVLTIIEIGEGEPLRQVQQFETDDEATLVLDLLSNGTHDPVFARSLQTASDLMHRL